jgi:hypothetical protein
MMYSAFSLNGFDVEVEVAHLLFGDISRKFHVLRRRAKEWNSQISIGVLAISPPERIKNAHSCASQSVVARALEVPSQKKKDGRA